MPTWDELRTARREGSLAAQRARRRLGLRDVRRVDVFDIIDDQGVWLMFQPLRDLYGFYRRIAADRAGIVLHAGHPLGVQRYTAAHELAHHLLGHAYSLDQAVDVGGALGADGADDEELALAARAHDDVGDPLQEAAAQSFAATFLMPVQAVNHALIEAGHDRDHPQMAPADVYALSLEFGTSYEATLTQLAVLTKVTWQQTRDLRLPPIQIKTMLAGRRPENARADMWVAHERHRERTFPLRVGDELLIRLPEIPSSGYAWELVDPAALPLSVIEERLDPEDDEQVVLGGIAQRRFHLRAETTGTADVTVRLTRPWESAAADNATFHVTVGAAPTGEAPSGLLEKQQRRLAQVA